MHSSINGKSLAIASYVDWWCLTFPIISLHHILPLVNTSGIININIKLSGETVLSDAIAIYIFMNLTIVKKPVEKWRSTLYNNSVHYMTLHVITNIVNLNHL